MNSLGANKIRKQSAEQKAKQIEKSKMRFKEKRNRRNPVMSDHPPVKHVDVQQEKRLRKRAQKQVENIQKRLDVNKQLTIKQTKHVRILEKEIAKLEYERYITRQKLSKMEEMEEELSKREKLFVKEQKRRKQAEQKVHKLTAQRLQKQGDGTRKVELSNQVKQLRESNKSLHKQIENYDLLSKEKFGNMKQELQVLRKEIHIYRTRERQIKKDPMFLVDYMKNYITSDYLPDLLSLIRNHIKTENLHHFYHNEQNVFYSLMRRVNLLKFRSQNRNNQYKLKSRTNSDNLLRLGYISYNDNRWVFVDITQANHSKIHKILENKSDESLSMDRPAKAILSQDVDGVVIIKCFSMKATINPQQKKKQTSPPSVKKEYLSFGNFKILVVGSRFLSDYKDRLEKHGCHAEIHNPFEESYEVLQGKVSRAEVILVCERHIPHSIWEYVDKKQPYVTVLKHDSKDLISTFTYLTLQRCELI